MLLYIFLYLCIYICISSNDYTLNWRIWLIHLEPNLSIYYLVVVNTLERDSIHSLHLFTIRHDCSTSGWCKIGPQISCRRSRYPWGCSSSRTEAAPSLLCPIQVDGQHQNTRRHTHIPGQLSALTSLVRRWTPSGRGKLTPLPFPNAVHAVPWLERLPFQVPDAS